MAPPIEDDDDDEAEQDNETLGLQKDVADGGDDSEVSQAAIADDELLTAWLHWFLASSGEISTSDFRVHLGHKNLSYAQPSDRISSHIELALADSQQGCWSCSTGFRLRRCILRSMRAEQKTHVHSGHSHVYCLTQCWTQDERFCYRCENCLTKFSTSYIWMYRAGRRKRRRLRETPMPKSMTRTPFLIQLTWWTKATKRMRPLWPCHRRRRPKKEANGSLCNILPPVTIMFLFHDYSIIKNV